MLINSWEVSSVSWDICRKDIGCIDWTRISEEVAVDLEKKAGGLGIVRPS